MKDKGNNKILIKDIEVEYSFKYSKVKYIRYELKQGKLIVVLPKNYKKPIEEVIHKKDKWIYNKIVKHNEKIKNLSEKTKNMSVVQRSLAELKQLVFEYIEEYETFLNVKVNRVQFRDTVYKWGSCSSLRNVTFSKNLSYLPDKLVAYIVYHELAHLIVLAHNDEFFNIIKKKFPNYERCDEKLNQYQFLIDNL